MRAGNPDRRGRPWAGVGLIAARAALVLVALVLLGTWIASLAEYSRRVSALEVPTVRRAGVVLTSNEMIREEAAGRGISVPSYAIYDLGLSLVEIAVFFGVAGLLIWRGKRSWFVWLTALVMIGMGSVAMEPALQVTGYGPVVLGIVDVASWSIWILMFLWIYLFPSGTGTPRWSVVPVGTCIAALGIMGLGGYLASLGRVPIEVGRVQAQVGPVIGVALLGLLVYSQVHRYRHVYTALEREQVKWFVFAVSVLLAEVILFVAVGLLGSELPAILQDLAGLLLIVLPLSVAFAVLRYRLYDIDLIINRTLVYVPLTAIVAGLMAAGVRLSQTAIVALTGKESDVAVVAATFVVVSLFTPIRNRLQTWVDGSFKDSADAGRRLGQFASRVGGVVDIVDPGRIWRLAVEECVAALAAEGGAVHRVRGRRRSVLFHSDGWDGRPEVAVAIVSQGGASGILSIGRRKSGSPYSAGDLRAVELLARTIAPALDWGNPNAVGDRGNRGGAAPGSRAPKKKAHSRVSTTGGRAAGSGRPTTSS